MIDVVIDVSHVNESPLWSQVHAAGIAGVIHKATQGTGSVDPAFASARTAAPAAGLLWGAYHFGTGDDAKAQAQFFLDTVQPDAQTLCAIDFESSGTPMSLAQLLAWVETVQNATGRPPVVYGGLSLLFPEIGTAAYPALAACPLWVAQYTPASAPSGIPPQVWKQWTLWRYTDNGRVDGIPTAVDRSRFAGTVGQLTAWWTGTAES
jgi:lysozyme